MPITLKPYLLTTQIPGCVRTRSIVKGISSFNVLDKAWAQAEKNNTPYDNEVYVAVRPATPEDIAKYGEWMI